jgi:uncharacterized protein (TIGR03085 family)
MSGQEGASASFAQRERGALADLFGEVGPDASTLCEGWTTRDLVAHLVLREGYLAAAGIAIRPLSRWTRRTQDDLSQEPFADLVRRFRDGPPTLSPLRLPGVQRTINTFEHFVHHEDVRRESDGWVARDLVSEDQHLLWHQLTSRARLFLKGAPVPVSLVAPDYGDIAIGNADHSTVRISGAPGELVMYVHGRRSHAEVRVTGEEASMTAWERHVLKV